MLLKHGFAPITVSLAQVTNDRQTERTCYKRGELYCDISFFQNHIMYGAHSKDWVLMEYFDSLHDVARWISEDGDVIPMDLPIKQIIDELEKDVLRTLNNDTQSRSLKTNKGTLTSK